MKSILYPFLIAILLLCNNNLSAQNLIAPPNLQKGDTVLILAPAGIMKDTVQ